jgi:alpha-beta hydrolase superfamily lysophospholipase
MTDLDAGRSVVRIPLASGRDEIEAWIYRPANASAAHPVVVMGHGFGAVKAGGMDAFAQRFCAEGFAVVVIDYRHWGGSSGQPRDLVHVRRQRDDYRAAIDWAASQPDIDAERIFIWGTSFSGLHVTALAASDRRIAGAIAQCPLVDGLAASLLARPTRSLGLFGAALLDRLGSLGGRTPWYIPVTVAPGRWGVSDTADAMYGQKLLTPREPVDWRNRVAARSILGIPMQRPARRAADIPIPFLLVIAETDTQTPVDSALKVAGRAPRAELRRSVGGHYDVYKGGKAFEDVVDWEVEFLRRHAGL